VSSFLECHDMLLLFVVVCKKDLRKSF